MTICVGAGWWWYYGWKNFSKTQIWMRRLIEMNYIAWNIYILFHKIFVSKHSPSCVWTCSPALLYMQYASLWSVCVVRFFQHHPGFSNSNNACNAWCFTSHYPFHWITDCLELTILHSLLLWAPVKLGCLNLHYDWICAIVNLVLLEYLTNTYMSLAVMSVNANTNYTDVFATLENW